MNAYRERQLGYQAEVGAAAIKEYSKSENTVMSMVFQTARSESESIARMGSFR